MSSTGERRVTRAVAPGANFLLLLLLFAALGIALRQDWVSGKGAAYVFAITAWILSLCLHEFGHAFVAWRGGDDRIPETGYLTLDPLRYVDPYFSFVMPLAFTLIGGLGFPGGAVRIDRRRIRSPVWQSAVSAAGPIMNGLCLAFLLVMYRATDDHAFALKAALAAAGYFQCTAIVLNLMPIPGLDGYGILDPWLPDSVRTPCREIARHSGLMLTALFALSHSFTNAVGHAGFTIAVQLGFSSAAIRAGYQAIHFW